MYSGYIAVTKQYFSGATPPTSRIYKLENLQFKDSDGTYKDFVDNIITSTNWLARFSQFPLAGIICVEAAATINRIYHPIQTAPSLPADDSYVYTPVAGTVNATSFNINTLSYTVNLYDWGTYTYVAGKSASIVVTSSAGGANAGSDIVTFIPTYDQVTSSNKLRI